MQSTFPVFDPASPQAESIRDLFVQVLFISAGIFGIVAVLICVALYKFRAREDVPKQDFGSHRREIAWMAGPVIIVLWIAAISIKLMLTINALPVQYAKGGEHSDDRVDLIVTGHQWWWEVEYVGTDVVSANEIHIPTGKKLRVELRSADVIHCFWVAQLTRKMDAIPGHTNYVWLEANGPGVYQGRCAEYCGTQHAWMNFLVIAHDPDDYEAWVQRESSEPAPPSNELAEKGKAVFMDLTCSQCHAISGTPAQEDFAPNLTHLASRRQIGAGVIENSKENLHTWLANPQAIKPGCKMPNFKLSDEQLDQLVAYLETLE
ncbi:cytochrome c oxidase subunit II [Bremerella cremea]|uniref:cytochrome c oxidase subunit II n=1 Tax=Bremerella cremea TaxID=1031537 RepID=UPI0031EAD2B6